MNFRTGRLVYTGAESQGELTRAIEDTFDEFQNIELAVPEKPDVTVHNFVKTGDFGPHLDLNAISHGFEIEHAEYEPEQFSRLVYRPPQQDVVALLFGSGKAILTGSSHLSEGEEAIEAMQTQLVKLDVLHRTDLRRI